MMACVCITISTYRSIHTYLYNNRYFDNAKRTTRLPPSAIHQQDDGHANLQLRHYFASSPSHRHYSPITRAAAPPSLMMASFHLVLVVRTSKSQRQKGDEEKTIPRHSVGSIRQEEEEESGRRDVAIGCCFCCSLESE